MIRSSGEKLLHLFSNFKWVRIRDYLSESCDRIVVASGPYRVSWSGDAGSTERSLKVPNYPLI